MKPSEWIQERTRLRLAQFPELCFPNGNVDLERVTPEQWQAHWNHAVTEFLNWALGDCPRGMRDPEYGLRRGPTGTEPQPPPTGANGPSSR
jgi:hypothetical protein